MLGSIRYGTLHRSSMHCTVCSEQNASTPFHYSSELLEWQGVLGGGLAVEMLTGGYTVLGLCVWEHWGGRAFVQHNWITDSLKIPLNKNKGNGKAKNAVLSRHKKMRVNCICVYVVTLWECMFVSARGLCTHIVCVHFLCVFVCVYGECLWVCGPKKQYNALLYCCTHDCHLPEDWEFTWIL